MINGGDTNTDGKMIVEPIFEEAGSFTVGLAPVKIDYKWRYIDITGKIVL